MNPECRIYENALYSPYMDGTNANATIYGYASSTAQMYAENHGYAFVALEPPALGDLNGDNFIDAVDATAILIEYASLSTTGESTLNQIQRKSADVNADGIIDAVDASAVLSYYAYLSTNGTQSFEDFLKENIQ